MFNTPFFDFLFVWCKCILLFYLVAGGGKCLACVPERWTDLRRVDTQECATLRRTHRDTDGMHTGRLCTLNLYTHEQRSVCTLARTHKSNTFSKTLFPLI